MKMSLLQRPVEENASPKGCVMASHAPLTANHVGAPAQREVAVKKPGFCPFSPVRTLAFSLILALPCYGQEKPADAPLVLQYPNGSALMNKAAFDKVDLEMKRLQQVEREHKAEPSWVIPILIGVAAGLAVGIPTTVVVVSAVQKSP